MKLIITLSLIVSFVAIAQRKPADTDLTQWVNPLVGSDSEYQLSTGNTYPAIAVPWGMNFWTPYTGKMGDGWQYSYDAFKIRGFKQTHQPSPWINDYGAFALMPVAGELKIGQDERASWFSHKREISKPHYYQVYLADYDTRVEITPTERAAMFRITYPAGRTSSLVLDAFDKGSGVKIDPVARTITGYCRNNHGGVPANFHNYFVLTFDTEFDDASTWDSAGVHTGSLEREGKHVGAAVRFKGLEKKVITIRVASSFISPEQARLNLEREVGTASFDEIRMKAQRVWNKELQRTRVEGGTQVQRTNFYTALYRLLLFPRRFFEYDAQQKIVHYSPYNGNILPGYLFTDNGFWDTFRAVFPYFTLMYPDMNSQMIEGLANAYKESGWLPEWASPGHRNCMIGSNSASLIADSYLKGIRGYDIGTLYEALMKNSAAEGPLTSVGRFGVQYYNALGYIPYDVSVNENVARTLEYSYDDFTIMKLARALGRPKAEIDTFAHRAYNYRNVFDRSTNFVRGRNRDGSFQIPFRPDKWGDAFTEGCAWHWTWCVFHDPQGLIDLMGGKEQFTAKLDSVFTAPPTFDYSYYGVQIHEITEMLIAGQGQYAHGNQPVQHAIYLYNYSGAPWKAQQRVRETMDLMYTPTPDGLCGDEDNGQTSAWYVFSALGFYPVCPGSNQYVIGSPIFDKVVLTLQNGKKFSIETRNNSDRNVYIQTAALNNKPYTRNFLRHEDIVRGGVLRFRMGDAPNRKRGIGDDDSPYSYSNEHVNIINVPTRHETGMKPTSGRK
ncbi:MAG TPA: GH92 family glycosyl hydrolase [Bacteroidota bacterium]|nr:GH92 family glycosyl hydrolase [Bacteroidota bacterium]